MKNIIIGLILGFILTSSFQVKAYNDSYTEWQQEVVDLLEEIVDNSNDIYSRMDNIIDKIGNIK